MRRKIRQQLFESRIIAERVPPSLVTCTILQSKSGVTVNRLTPKYWDALTPARKLVDSKICAGFAPFR